MCKGKEAVNGTRRRTIWEGPPDRSSVCSVEAVSQRQPVREGAGALDTVTLLFLALWICHWCLPLEKSNQKPGDKQLLTKSEWVRLTGQEGGQERVECQPGVAGGGCPSLQCVSSTWQRDQYL